MGFWQKLKKIYMGDVFGSAISEADEAFFDDLEEMLILADVGLETATEVVKELRQRMIEDKISGQEPVKACLREILAEKLSVGSSALDLSTRPSVVLVVGVNGAGKTTTIGKMAAQFKRAGNKVMLGAADTFRAAAIEQLEEWGRRADVPVVKQKIGADPASVAFDTLQSAIANNVDVVIIDTAGRLHNKKGLMDELSKVKSVMQKLVPDAPHEVLLVLDGSTGQNAFEQAKQFVAATQVNELAITKLDGTAKGGVVIGISDQFKIPVKYIGLGEKIDDLQVFDKRSFVESLFGNKK